MNLNDSFRYLHMGVPDDIARLQGIGDFDEAIRRIDENWREPAPRRCARVSWRIGKFCDGCRWTIHHRETAVAYAASILPGFNGAEFDELERAGRIDWIQYNGAPHYSSSFLDTLCKTDPAYAARAGSAWGGGVDVKYIGGVRRELIAKLKEKGTMTLRFGVRETLRLREDLFRPGMRLRAYLPLPCASEGQHDITVSAPDANHPLGPPRRTSPWPSLSRRSGRTGTSRRNTASPGRPAMWTSPPSGPARGPARL